MYYRKRKNFKSKKTKKPFRSYRRRFLRHNPMVEKKHIDRLASFNVTNLGTINVLTDVLNQGAGETQRIGDSIYALYLFLKLKVTLTTGSTYDNIRVIIVRDTMGVNAPVVTDILDGGQLGGGFAPLAQYNHFYLSRWRRLYDRVHKISDGGGQSLVIQRTIPIYSKLDFIGASTFKNQVYILLVSDESNILALPSCTYSTRLLYTDR